MGPNNKNQLTGFCLIKLHFPLPPTGKQPLCASVKVASWPVLPKEPLSAIAMNNPSHQVKFFPDWIPREKNE